MTDGYINKYTFKHEDEGGQITVETSVETIDELLGEFEDFMKGCGFFFEGHLQIVQEEEQ